MVTLRTQIVAELHPIVDEAGVERQVGECFEFPLLKAKGLVTRGKARWPEAHERIECGSTTTDKVPIVIAYVDDEEVCEDETPDEGGA